MMKYLFLPFAVGLVFVVSISFKPEPSTIVKDDLKKFYDFYKVDGSFILYDQNNDRYIYYNQKQTTQSFTPASTFKICNSLIALENGIVQDEHVVFNWDGRDRQVPAWNKDTDMRQAFKNSTVWYYQELARRTGGERMKFWLDRVHYGNADTTGGVDAFWLSGNLRITPAEQIVFLKRLHDNKLPFSKRSMDIVKDIMINKDTLGCVIRAKSGAGKQGNQYVGWYVGYVTTRNNTYYFSNCIQTSARRTDFNEARLQITYNILSELNVLKK
jgi:beta-lactamase class D